MHILLLFYFYIVNIDFKLYLGSLWIQTCELMGADCVTVEAFSIGVGKKWKVGRLRTWRARNASL